VLTPDIQLTSRKEVVSRIKNMLIIPRYLVIFAPGRKERGVILTTETVELVHDGTERCRKYPSANGLVLSSEAAKKMGEKRTESNYQVRSITVSQNTKNSSLWFPNSLVTTFSCLWCSAISCEKGNYHAMHAKGDKKLKWNLFGRVAFLQRKTLRRVAAHTTIGYKVKVKKKVPTFWNMYSAGGINYRKCESCCVSPVQHFPLKQVLILAN